MHYIPQTLDILGLHTQSGVVLLEFGADWCPHCQRVRPWVQALLTQHPAVRHIPVADGRGHAPGRHYQVKLWPTLIVLRDGIEHTRLVRPQKQEDIDAALKATISI